MKSLVWLLFETALLTPDFSLQEQSVFAGRIHKLTNLGLSIYDDEEEAEEIDDVSFYLCVCNDYIITNWLVVNPMFENVFLLI